MGKKNKKKIGGGGEKVIQNQVDERREKPDLGGGGDCLINKQIENKKMEIVGNRDEKSRCLLVDLKKKERTVGGGDVTDHQLVENKKKNRITTQPQIVNMKDGLIDGQIIPNSLLEQPNQSSPSPPEQTNTHLKGQTINPWHNSVRTMNHTVVNSSSHSPTQFPFLPNVRKQLPQFQQSTSAPTWSPYLKQWSPPHNRFPTTISPVTEVSQEVRTNQKISITNFQHLPVDQQIPVQQPKVKQENDVKKLEKNFQTLGIQPISKVPKRSELKKQSRGKPGKKITVETNHLNLNFKNLEPVHHYDVSVYPEKPSKFNREVFEKTRLRYFPNNNPAYDGKKNAYSAHPLPFKEDTLIHTLTIKDHEQNRDRELTIQIKFANKVDMSSVWDYIKSGTSLNIPREALQVWDIVLRQPSAKKFCQIGKSYFTPPPGKVVELGDGMVLWYGFFQSAIIGWKPFLNIDVAHKGFPEADKCLNVLKKMSKIDIKKNSKLSTNDYTYVNFQTFIKGLKVVYERPTQLPEKRTYTVRQLGLSAREKVFEKDNVKTTILDYFQSEYKYTIEYPDLPCLQCGSMNKPISLPLELCSIQKGQIVMRKMNENQTRNMVRASAVPPAERKLKIEASMRQVGFNDDPCIKEFGITVDSQFIKVPARILDPPKLEYNERQVVQVVGGVWRTGKFQKTYPLNQWAIYSTDQKIRNDLLRELSKRLRQASDELGMQINEPSDTKVMKNPRDLQHDLSKLSNCQVVFVVLAERGPISYAQVKKVAEINIGMLTQCIKTRTLTRLTPSTLANILLKLNAKLNGVNHSIQGGLPLFLNRPVIVVGADVTHPSPCDRNPEIPSIAAVAASHDPSAFSYNIIWKIQQAQQEIILELEGIMREQLLLFYRKTGYKPEAILFYRDGLSDGQFKQAIDVEVRAVQRACKRLQSDGYDPHITFIVVQKRHHTRFFPEAKDAVGKTKNVPAGTIVDENITHPTEIDFYLVSHASIQGTSRPTKYHLLYDDSNMTDNELEELTYYLCHLFTRCTRSVSYPAPTYYAHLAAFRARSYIENETKKDLTKEVSKNLSQSNPMYFV